MEIELKLTLAKQDIEKFKQHPLLHAANVAGPFVSNVVTQYFDTPSHKLHTQDIALRLREVDGLIIQTVKAGGETIGGLHQRHEWETRLARSQIDFTAIPEPLRQNIQAIADQLIPLFQTVMQRHTWLLKEQAVEVEIALDEGIVQIGDNSTPFCEVELELKHGEDVQKLREIAKQFRQTIQLTEESLSKADRGYQLHRQVQGESDG